MQFAQKVFTAQTVYCFGRLTSFRHYAEGHRELNGHEMAVSNVLAHEDYAFPLTESLLECRAELESCLSGVEAELNCRFDARVAMLFEERAERVSAGVHEDIRYRNSLRIVMKSRRRGAVIDERLVTSTPSDVVISATREARRRFVERAAHVPDQARSSAINQRGAALLSPKAAGHFFHETLGHMIEADTFRYVDERLSGLNFDPKIVYRDHTRGSEALLGIGKIDDEGTPIRDATFVSAGRLVDTIRTACHNPTDAPLRGFARAAAVHYPPLPRMRMCVLEPCTVPSTPPLPDRLLSLDNVYNGSVLPNVFKYVLSGSGYVIRGGERTAYLPRLTLTGDLFTSLQHVPFIGCDSEEYAADCTKNGQIVRVGHRSPSVLLDDQMFRGEGFAL